MTIWDKLKKPILALAPMYGVTDSVFRRVISRIGFPDIMFTEFVAADGLCNSKSQDKIISNYLRFSDEERPLVMQIWGSDPEKIAAASKLASDLGFDGIDINMGCPDKKVVAAGGGAALIKNPKKAGELIAAAKSAGNLPVSVKTRIGFEKIETEKWMTELSAAKPAAITLHLRTMKEMSKVPAHWEEAEPAARIAHASGIKILGNGDIMTKASAIEKIKNNGLDGAMIGRGVFSNFWVFKTDEPRVSVEDRINLMLVHMKIFQEEYAGVKDFVLMRKNIGNYISGFRRAREMRAAFMEAKNYAQAADTANRIVNEYAADFVLKYETNGS